MTPLAALKYLGTGTGIAGALTIAANVPVSGWGFALFLLSSTAWSLAAHTQRDGALLLLNLTFTAINILGVYRWIIL